MSSFWAGGGPGRRDGGGSVDSEDTSGDDAGRLISFGPASGGDGWRRSGRDGGGGSSELGSDDGTEGRLNEGTSGNLTSSTFSNGPTSPSALGLRSCISSSSNCLPKSASDGNAFSKSSSLGLGRDCDADGLCRERPFGLGAGGGGCLAGTGTAGGDSSTALLLERDRPWVGGDGRPSVTVGRLCGGSFGWTAGPFGRGFSPVLAELALDAARFRLDTGGFLGPTSSPRPDSAFIRSAMLPMDAISGPPVEGARDGVGRPLNQLR